MIFPEAVFSLADINAAFVRKFYMLGFDIVDASNTPIADDVIEYWLLIGSQRLELEIGINVLPRTFTAEKHDYYANDYINYCFMRLFHWPVREIKKISIHYEPNKDVVVYPNEWVRIELQSGQLRLVPTISQQYPLTMITGANSAWAPFILNMYTDGFPQYWHVDYVSGFKGNEIPFELIDPLVKLALLNLIDLASVTIVPLAGAVRSESVSVDGLAQSRGYGQPFEWLLNSWRKDLFGEPGGPESLLMQLRDKYKGLLIDGL